VNSGNASTIWVVLCGPLCSRSSMARRVGSESAFQTASRSSAIVHPGRSLGEVLADVIEIPLPARADVLAVRFIQEADRAVTQGDPGATGGLVQLDLDVIERGV